MTALYDRMGGRIFGIGWADPQEPYKFPEQLKICAGDNECEAILLDEGSGDLCDSSKWDVSGQTGWAFRGRAPFNNEPADECFWELPITSNFGLLDRNPVSLKSFHDTRLVYSVGGRFRNYIFFLVSDNGFNNYTRVTSTGCRVIMQYPFRNSGGTEDYRSGKDFFTEILDISDFDGSENVQIRFIKNLGDTTLNEGFRIYDLSFDGRGERRVR